MEIAGLVVGGVGLAGLYSACVEIIERIESYKNIANEARELLTEFEINRVIFRKWADRVGISSKGVTASHDPRLDDAEVANAVCKVLVCIRSILVGTTPVRSALEGRSPMQKIARQNSGRSGLLTEASTATQDSLRKRDRFGWTFGGKQRFATQVELFGVFVGKLNMLIPDLGDGGNKIVRRNTVVGEPIPTIEMLQHILKRIEDEEREKFLAWLGGIPYSERYDTCLGKRTAGTCDWIHQQPVFISWISSEFPKNTSKFLWIHGAAGYGKSVLCASIIQRLRQDNQPVFYYFHRSVGQRQENSNTILRAWIGQMVAYDPIILQLAQNHVRQALDRHSRRLIWDLLELLIEALPCTLVLDGLDEYYEVNGEDSRGEFLLTLKETVANKLTRVLVVSRDEVDIRLQLSPRPDAMDVSYYEHAITKEDLAADTLAFSKSITKLRLGSKSQEIKDEIAEKLATKCDGMFLWVDLQQRNLRGSKNKYQLDKIIDELPVNLESVYRRSWNEIQEREPSDRKRAMNILRWATCGLRPLTVAEMTEALAVADEEDGDFVDAMPDAIDEEYIDGEILALCGSLIELRVSGSDASLKTKTIHLKHFSVKEFLLTTSARSELFKLNENEESNIDARHDELALTCLRYLESPSVQSLQSSTFDRAFFDYAVWAWPEHIPLVYDHFLSSCIDTLFGSDSQQWIMWRTRYEQIWQEQHPDEASSEVQCGDASRMYYLAYFGFCDVLEQKIAQDQSLVNKIGGMYGTLAKAACVTGHTTIVSKLITLGASPEICIGRWGTLLGVAAVEGFFNVCKELVDLKVDLDIADQHGETPLLLASKKGNLSIVQLLCESGADTLKCQEDGLSPLATAARTGHPDVVRLLLEYKHDTENQSEQGWTALDLAAATSNMQSVQLLLEHGASVSVKDNHGNTPLMSAAIEGSVEVCELLLRHGSDLAARNNEGKTVLHYAARHGYLKLVQALLAHGAELSPADNDGYTPLLWASAIGDGDKLEVVELLVQRGADLSAVDNEGYTALLIACLTGQTELVRFFLKQGADWAVQSKALRFTCLGTAASKGYDDITRILLDHGVDVMARNKIGFTALHMAAYNGHTSTIGLLVDYGCPIDDLTSSGTQRTALRLACGRGNYDAAKELLGRGADPNSNPDHVAAPLYSAASNGHLAVVKLLVEHGAIINVAQGLRPISGAAEAGILEIAEYLFEKGCDVSLQEQHSYPPLVCAASNGDTAMMLLLLNHGARVNIRDTSNDHALKCAAEKGHLNAVRLCLEQGAIVNMEAANGCTALNAACRCGDLSIVQLLLHHGADLSADDNGWTPVFSASRCGCLDVIKTLVAHGDDLHARNRFGWAPISVASFEGHTEVVRYLLEMGADVTVRNQSLFNPLTMAISKGHTETAKLLIEHNAETAEVTRDGSTPLHFAAKLGDADLLELLLKKDHILDSLDSRSASCLHLACRRDEISIVKLLLAAGANRTPIDDLGRTAYDWAVAGLPEMSSDELWGENPDNTSKHIRQQHVRKNLVAHLRAATSRAGIFYHLLAKYLITLEDIPNARRASEERITRSDDDGPIHPSYCDLCDREESITTTSRYVCISCADVDLCETCYATFRDGPTTWRCQQHEFFEVKGDEDTLVRLESDDHLQRQDEWLKAIEEQYAKQVPDEEMVVDVKKLELR